MARLFGGVYAPSTLGSFLGAFSHGHVRQPRAVSREFLVQIAGRTPLPPGTRAVTFLDVDSLMRRMCGKKKQGVGFEHPKVGGYKVLLRGYNPLLATISTRDAAPVIAATQLRAGNTMAVAWASSSYVQVLTGLSPSPRRARTRQMVPRSSQMFFRISLLDVISKWDELDAPAL